MQTILEFEKVSFCYPRSQKEALRDISFCIASSEFVVLCGQSGCGKSTLLRHMKKNQIPFGKGSGRILFQGEDLERMDDRESARRIGYVGQNPENQIVTDTVWHELAFGLENLGIPREEIRKRTAEMAEYFGIGKWFREPVSALSGGQKQILNLASVMVMKPQLLILDEPTSQLDPIGARRFIQTLLQINQDFGTTIILSEQRLEEVLPIADRLMLMHEGELLGIEKPAKCSDLLRQIEIRIGREFPVMGGMPTALRVFLEYQKMQGGELTGYPPGQLKVPEKRDSALPLTVREGKNWLRTILDEKRQQMQQAEDKTNAQEAQRIELEPVAAQIQEEAGRIPSFFARKKEKEKKSKEQSHVVLLAKQVGFRYRKEQRLLEEFQIAVEQGSIYAILGGNGSGKTTALKVLAGVYRNQSGKIKAEGRVRYLAQNPQSIFTEITVQDELAEALEDYGEKGRKKRDAQLQREQLQQRVEEMMDFMELTPQRMQNPLDLSGGQQQRLALGKILLLEPDILLLDEPTKGLDAAFKKKFSQLLKKLVQREMTIVMVSHDMEFCAENATHCGLLFDGQMISSNTTREFFAENSFYTTAASRMSSGVLESCILPEDILKKLGFGVKY